ncbi:MAG: hypothetical protein R3286_16750 [Gammaproteobacteria bacterium]|nr:hypothetical protein [Gammaproteobacteria bacterium]
MTPPGPLGDDWLYWDPLALESYPHSIDTPAEERDEAELDAFDQHEDGCPRCRATGR